MQAIQYDSIAQSNCPVRTEYKTNFIGDGNDTIRLFFPLVITATTDSIIISYLNENRQFLAFKIMAKECFWNETFSEGKSTYKLMLYDIAGNKYPTLTITGDKKQPVYIELLYENSNQKVFSQL